MINTCYNVLNIGCFYTTKSQKEGQQDMNREIRRELFTYYGAAVLYASITLGNLYSSLN